MKTQQEIDGEHLIEALKLTRERITGDSVEAKQDRWDRMSLAIASVRDYLDGGARVGGDRPSAADLRELLGDPDDKATRDALANWD